MITAGQQLAQQANANVNEDVFGSILYNVKAYGAKGNGENGDTANISKAITVAAVKGGIVFFPPGTYITDSLVVPTNVTLDFANGAKLSVKSGSTVTINGPIDAGIQHIFSGNGTVSGLKRCESIFPQWFGAMGDGTNDDTNALQKTINAIGVQGGKITVKPGNYRITDTLVIANPVTILGDGYSWSDGTTIIGVNMDGKNIEKPAIKIHTTQSVIIHGFYIINQGTELRDGLAIDGHDNGNFDQMAGFVNIERVMMNKFRSNFLVNHSWFVSFRDCHAIRGTYGWTISGGTITTTLFDHCFASDNTEIGFHVNGAYYTTFVACASDKQRAGYRLSNAESVAMLGCASEGTVNTAIDIENSTVVIDGFTSVDSGTANDNNYATMLNAVNSYISARGFSEITKPANIKTLSIAFNDGCIGEYSSTGRELLALSIPKNGKIALNGQTFTQGVPTATNWKPYDIGKILHESNPVEAGSAGSKYVIFGYQRLTSGNGNVIGTDWLRLRALTGN